jgi:hypothetical protein
MDGFPNELWRLYNLRESPFFQEALETTPEAKYPISLFVGRMGDANRLLRHIEAHPNGSRQAVAGALGTGKTTLVQYVKSALEARSIFGASRAVSLGPSDGENEVAIRIIDYVYRTILSRGDFTAHDNPAMEAARALVRVFVNRSHAASPTLALEQLLPELLAFAREYIGASGIVVHLNNLEHLSESDEKRAASTLRALRDRCLLIEGYHWLVVGTTAAVASVINTHRQVKSVFPLWRPLEPLAARDVLSILDRRYDHLRADRSRPHAPPVAAAAVKALYALFNGDLRSTLQALDQSASELLGYSNLRADAPLTLADIGTSLQHAYADTLAQDLSEEDVPRLRAAFDRFGTEAMIPKELQALWRVSQPTTSTVVRRLVDRGYLAPASPRVTEGTGRPAMQYVVTGATRLAFRTP